MTSVPDVEPLPRVSPGRRLSTFFFRHPRLRLGGLLAAPLGWMVVIYLGSLFLLLLASFWQVGGILGTEIVHSWNLDNYRELVQEPVYRTVAFRTISMAVFVTIADAVLAFPLAYYMARIASPRTRNLLVVAVLMPLWASYLVKAYAWRTMLGEEGVINWLLAPFGLSGPGYSTTGLWLAFTYLWLPFMILPIYAGLERIPGSLLEASADLGGRSLRDLLEGHAAARLPRGRRRLDLHLLADARRLHPPGPRREPAVHRDGDLLRSRVAAAAGGGVRDGARRRHDRLPVGRQAPRGVREPVTA